MPEFSDHLANAIEARRRQLGYTPKTLALATGLSSQALKNIRKGEVRQYQDRTVLPLARALRWTPDSISRLLGGEEPVDLREESSALYERETQLEQQRQALWDSSPDDPSDPAYDAVTIAIGEIDDELRLSRARRDDLRVAIADSERIIKSATAPVSAVEIDDMIARARVSERQASQREAELSLNEMLDRARGEGASEREFRERHTVIRLRADLDQLRDEVRALAQVFRDELRELRDELLDDEESPATSDEHEGGEAQPPAL